MSENRAVHPCCVLEVDADYRMKCTQSDLEGYGVRCGDMLYIKAWQATGKLFAVYAEGSDRLTIVTRGEFQKLTLNKISFYGAVVSVVRNLKEGRA